MNSEDRQQELDAAWQRLTALYYQYSQIVEQEIGPMWQEVNQKFFDCHEGQDRHLTEDQSKIDAAIQAVTQLEASCKEIAGRWDAERINNPITPDHLQEQSLTQEDETFIQEQRAALAEVAPEVGKLDVYFETGTEGAYWSVEVDGLEGYDSLRLLHDGDRLVVYNDDGSVLFDEVFIEDHVSGWAPYRPLWPYGLGQQACGGLWVHWIPKGWSSQSWAKLFNAARGKRAELYHLADPPANQPSDLEETHDQAE